MMTKKYTKLGRKRLKNYVKTQNNMSRGRKKLELHLRNFNSQCVFKFSLEEI